MPLEISRNIREISHSSQSKKRRVYDRERLRNAGVHNQVNSELIGSLETGASKAPKRNRRRENPGRERTNEEKEWKMLYTFGYKINIVHNAPE